MPELTTGTAPLVVTRIYRAPRERVFSAWITKADLERWYTPEGVVAVEHLDVRVGGSYRVRFGAPDEPPYFETGSYEAIDPPRMLRFRALLESGGAVIADTLCTIEFRDLGDSTEVVMSETGFPEAAREDRRGGWGRTLDRLFPVVEGG